MPGPGRGGGPGHRRCAQAGGNSDTGKSYRDSLNIKCSGHPPNERLGLSLLAAGVTQIDLLIAGHAPAGVRPPSRRSRSPAPAAVPEYYVATSNSHNKPRLGPIYQMLRWPANPNVTIRVVSPPLVDACGPGEGLESMQSNRLPLAHV